MAGLAPLANALGALTRGWLPYGDEAIIATRAHDFGTTLTPLLGMPSTFAAISSFNPTQPGPLQFWTLGPFCRLLGPAAGVLTGTAMVNGLSIVGIGLVAQRRCGRRAAFVGLAVALVLILLMNSPTYSFEPVNSIAPVVPLMFTLTLAWAVADGDVAWLPVLVLAGSFTAQADLEFVGVVLIAGVWAVGTRLVPWVRLPGRAGERHPGQRPDGAADADPSTWRRHRTVLGSTVIAGLCWSGPLLEAARHGGGNLREIWLAFVTPGRTLGIAGVGRGLGAALAIPPLFLRDGTSPAQWARGLDLTVLITVVGLGLLWQQTRSESLSGVHRLVTAAGVTTLAAGANAYRLPVEPFTNGHTMFARGVGAFVWFAVITATVEVASQSGLARWRLPMALAGIGTLVVGLPHWPASAVVAVGGTWLVIAAVIICLRPLLIQVISGAPMTAAGAKAAGERSGRYGASTTDRRLLRPLGALAVAVLAISVALPPNLRTAYRGWIYNAIPPLDHQVHLALAATPVRRPNAVVVAAAGGDRYLDVAKALISSLEASGTPTLVGNELIQTYGSRRSYRAHQDRAVGEVLVVPNEDRHLPAGARLIASWRPRDWDPGAVLRLRTDIGEFVRGHGLTLTAAGHNRMWELFSYAVSATPPHRDDAGRLASLPAAVLTNLYAEPWAVATPQLPPALRARFDHLLAAPAIDIWFIPAPLPARTGLPG